MELVMIDWFCAIVRMAGVTLPATAWLVQLQAELDNCEFKKRLKRLEDPISSLHADMPEVSRAIYEAMIAAESNRLHFERIFYEQYSQSLAILESRGMIKGLHGLGREGHYAQGFRIIDPSFVTYMHAIHGNSKGMGQLVDRVEGCGVGQWLNGEAIAHEMGVSLPIVKAVFEVFELKGYGQCSKTNGRTAYRSQISKSGVNG